MAKSYLMRAFIMIMMVSLVICLSVNVNAFTTYATYTIDNDDAQGYTNSRIGFDTWFSSGALYYQDARKQACDSSYYEYVYQFSPYSRYTPIYGQVSAYLYNVNFTDPSAFYGIADTYTYYIASAGYINQNLAAAGWNIIGTATTTHSFPDTGKYVCDFVKVIPSTENNAGTTCGADAIEVVLGY